MRATEIAKGAGRLKRVPGTRGIPELTSRYPLRSLVTAFARAPTVARRRGALYARALSPPWIMPPDLQSLRREIDAIDDAIHDLLMQRARVVGGVLAAKGKGGAVFQPAREADILLRLAARHRGALRSPRSRRYGGGSSTRTPRLQRPNRRGGSRLRPPVLAALAWQHFGGIGAIHDRDQHKCSAGARAPAAPGRRLAVLHAALRAR